MQFTAITAPAQPVAPAPATTAPAPTAVGPATPPPAPTSTPPSLGAILLGKSGGAQQRALEGQQLLGAVSNMFTQRMSMIGHNVWALLRGAKPEAEPASDVPPAA
jgi:hypothetical protein